MEDSKYFFINLIIKLIVNEHWDAFEALLDCIDLSVNDKTFNSIIEESLISIKNNYPKAEEAFLKKIEDFNLKIVETIEDLVHLLLEEGFELNKDFKYQASSISYCNKNILTYLNENHKIFNIEVKNEAI